MKMIVSLDASELGELIKKGFEAQNPMLQVLSVHWKIAIRSIGDQRDYETVGEVSGIELTVQPKTRHGLNE